MTIKMSRTWAMQSADTFDCKPIGDFVRKYLCAYPQSVDPFARDKNWATYTNDLNPNTKAQYHMEAREFLKMLIEKNIHCNLVIIDPPYSQAQVSRSYKSVGREYKPFGEDNNAVLYKDVRYLANKILRVGGWALSFGWNSVGFGKNLGYELREMMVVCHGGAHNDTICIAEKKMYDQAELDRYIRQQSDEATEY